MGLTSFKCGKDSCAVNDKVYAKFTPWDGGWVTESEDAHLISVDGEGVLIVSDFTRVATMDGVEFEEVGHVFWVEEGIVETDELDVTVF